MVMGWYQESLTIGCLDLANCCALTDCVLLAFVLRFPSFTQAVLHCFFLIFWIKKIETSDFLFSLCFLVSWCVNQVDNTSFLFNRKHLSYRPSEAIHSKHEIRFWTQIQRIRNWRHHLIINNDHITEYANRTCDKTPKIQSGVVFALSHPFEGHLPSFFSLRSDHDVRNGCILFSSSSSCLYPLPETFVAAIRMSQSRNSHPETFINERFDWKKEPQKDGWRE